MCDHTTCCSDVCILLCVYGYMCLHVLVWSCVSVHAHMCLYTQTNFSVSPQIPLCVHSVQWMDSELYVQVKERLPVTITSSMLWKSWKIFIVVDHLWCCILVREIPLDSFVRAYLVFRGKEGVVKRCLKHMAEDRGWLYQLHSSLLWRCMTGSFLFYRYSLCFSLGARSQELLSTV